MMNAAIENIPAYSIAYVRKTGPYGQANALVMEQLKEWARNNGLLNHESIVMGIARDNPATTKPEDCRYDACIVIKSDALVNDDSVSRGNVAGGRYLVFLVEHTEEAVRKAWIGIFPELSKRRFQFDETRPILERYRAELIKAHLCEICVPVR